MNRHLFQRFLSTMLCLSVLMLSACGAAKTTTPGSGGAAGSANAATPGNGGAAGSGNKSSNSENGGTDLPNGIRLLSGEIGSGSAVPANTTNLDKKQSASATVASTDFGLKMLQKELKSGENMMISPASVLFALGMMSNGARNNTLSQLEAMFGIPAAELNAYLCAYRQSLPNEENCKVSAANSIWFKDSPDLSVFPDFLQINRDYYDAGIYAAPFDDSTRDAINLWVKEHTSEMIDKILDEIPADAVMYLINAMAFDAKWMEPYEENDVRENDFTREDGTVQKVDFMYSEEQEFLEDDKAVGFLKYYEGGKYAFAALLPEEGLALDKYVSTLTGEKLNRILNHPQPCSVHAALPKFEAEYSTELSQTLGALGISDSFDPAKADFTGLAVSVGGNIYISRVLHKTYISVVEKGTKAAAVTAIEARDECAMIEPEYKEVYLNRPFVYFLIDCEEGLPVFMGTVYEID